MERIYEGHKKICPDCGKTATFRTRTLVSERDGGRLLRARVTGPDTHFESGWSCDDVTCEFYERLPMEEVPA